MQCFVPNIKMKSIDWTLILLGSFNPQVRTGQVSGAFLGGFLKVSKRCLGEVKAIHIKSEQVKLGQVKLVQVRK